MPILTRITIKLKTAVIDYVFVKKRIKRAFLRNEMRSIFFLVEFIL